MSKLIGRMHVDDYKTWRADFDSLYDARVKYGCTGEQVFTGNPNDHEVLVITEWGSREQARKYSESPELLEAMKRSGYSKLPEFFIVD